MNARIVLFAAAIAGLGSVEAADRTVVVELFTSQGCSSCPPADAILRNVAKQTSVLALSRPITYWDDLGWKDTLALPGNTDKQKAYSQAMGKGGRIYTPQIVVDGQAEGIGSNADTVASLIAAATARPNAASVSATPSAGGWQIAVSGAPGAEVHLISYRPEAKVKIDAGENEGEEISYTDAVSSDTILGLAADQTPFSAPATDGKDDLRWAVVVQEPHAGPIRAALKLDPSTN